MLWTPCPRCQRTLHLDSLLSINGPNAFSAKSALNPKANLLLLSPSPSLPLLCFLSQQRRRQSSCCCTPGIVIVVECFPTEKSAWLEAQKLREPLDERKPCRNGTGGKIFQRTCVNTVQQSTATSLAQGLLGFAPR